MQAGHHAAPRTEGEEEPALTLGSAAGPSEQGGRHGRAPRLRPRQRTSLASGGWRTDRPEAVWDTSHEGVAAACDALRPDGQRTAAVLRRVAEVRAQ